VVAFNKCTRALTFENFLFYFLRISGVMDHSFATSKKENFTKNQPNATKGGRNVSTGAEALSKIQNSKRPPTGDLRAEEPSSDVGLADESRPTTAVGLSKDDVLAKGSGKFGSAHRVA
jgi:hypothetical protein